MIRKVLVAILILFFVVIFLNFSSSLFEVRKHSNNAELVNSLNKSCVRGYCENICEDINEELSQITFDTINGKVNCKCGFKYEKDNSNLYKFNNFKECKGVKTNEKS